MADSSEVTEEVLDGGLIPAAVPQSSSTQEPAKPAYDINASNLDKYEEMFKDRFSEASESFKAISENGFDKVFTLYPWTSRPKRNFDYGRRNGRDGRGGGRGGGGYRRDRDWDNRDNRRDYDRRDGRDQYSRNDRGDRYRRDRGGDNYGHRDRDDRGERVQYPGRR